MDLFSIGFFWFLTMLVGTEIYINMPCQAVHRMWLGAHATNSVVKLIAGVCAYCAAVYMEIVLLVDFISRLHVVDPPFAEHIPIFDVMLGLALCIAIEYLVRQSIVFNWKKQFEVLAAIRQLDAEDELLHRSGGVEVDPWRPSPFSTAHHFKCKTCGERCRTYSETAAEKASCNRLSCGMAQMILVHIELRRAA